MLLVLVMVNSLELKLSLILVTKNKKISFKIGAKQLLKYCRSFDWSCVLSPLVLTGFLDRGKGENS